MSPWRHHPGKPLRVSLGSLRQVPAEVPGDEIAR